MIDPLAATELATDKAARRVLIVQYAGDYREAVNRLSAGGSETYFAQRYSVQSVARLGELAGQVAVLVCMTEAPYDEVLSNWVRAIGAGFHGKLHTGKLLSLIEQQHPTDLVLCTPVREVLHWAADRNVRTMALFADSFRSVSFRARYKNRRLANALNRSGIEWVGNHNVNASRSLQQMGVDGNKIVPWDWLSNIAPDRFEARTLSPCQDTYRLLYVGSVIEDKGVGDLLRAVALLKQRGIKAALQLAGEGDLAKFKVLALNLGIADRTFFLGLVPNESVVDLMRQADAVVIPSRHFYPEGLPMTIYEALCSRTPILASDHEMFQGKLQHGVSALIFTAENPEDLAAKTELLFSSSELYAKLSANSAEAWRRLQIPVKFDELLRRWIRNSEEDQYWIRDRRLTSGLYDDN